jgi:hypothetical protein
LIDSDVISFVNFIRYRGELLQKSSAQRCDEGFFCGLGSSRNLFSVRESRNPPKPFFEPRTPCRIPAVQTFRENKLFRTALQNLRNIPLSVMPCFSTRSLAPAPTFLLGPSECHTAAKTWHPHLTVHPTRFTYNFTNKEKCEVSGERVE